MVYVFSCKNCFQDRIFFFFQTSLSICVSQPAVETPQWVIHHSSVDMSACRAARRLSAIHSLCVSSVLWGCLQSTVGVLFWFQRLAHVGARHSGQMWPIKVPVLTIRAWRSSFCTVSDQSTAHKLLKLFYDCDLFRNESPKRTVCA